MARNLIAFALFLLAAVTLLHSTAEAAPATYTVGDSMGWTVPPNSSVSYATWASGKTFKVGDILGNNKQPNPFNF